jgi:hypothetical protein
VNKEYAMHPVLLDKNPAFNLLETKRIWEKQNTKCSR